MNSFMIGPVKEGLRLDLKPYATPEDSFQSMVNAYQWRGRILRRPGYSLLGNLANGTPVMGLRTQENFAIDAQTLIAFDTTQAYEWNGTTFVSLPSVMPVTWSGSDSQFFWSINYAGAFWATNGKAGLNGVAISNAVAGAGFTTITTSSPHGFTTGQTVAIINITSTAGTGVDDLNGNTYVITVTGANTFTIPFQTTNIYASGGFVLNSQVTTTGQDGIRYYGILSNGTGWANYNPPIDPNTALAGCLMMFAYRGYLVFLNTIEGNDAGTNNYGNRARWTQIGTPYYSPPTPQNPNVQGFDYRAARDDLFGRGGANDAPTNEVIVSAAFIRDILVVYFERSTWRLRFVNNAQNPFVWERVNIEFGSSSTFSGVPFDKGLMTIGNRGIVICDGNDTIRFDEKIPDEVFKIRQTNNGALRVQGIRTFETKLVYWTYPDNLNTGGIYPDKVLVFNYDTGNWSYFDDCFTCFGYYYPSGTGLTWASLTEPWEETTLSWDSGFATVEKEQIIAGNQQGFVFVLEADTVQNSPSLNISAIVAGTFTSNNHNLPQNTWISLSGIIGTTSANGVSLNGRNFKLANPTMSANQFTLQEFEPIDAGTASGTTFSYTISYQNIIPTSVVIYVGTLTFVDNNGNGVLTSTGGSGTINYTTGALTLTFSPSIGSTEVYIYLVTADPTQQIVPLSTTGAYGGSGQITKISNIDIQTKYFNFFGDDQRSRLSRIDFYVDSTANGQFTANIFSDASNTIANTPLPDNPFQNVVVTALNPYQYGTGIETIYRLYCSVIAQTVQVQMTLQDYQMAVNSINSSPINIVAMMFGLRRGGRLV